MNKVVTQVPCNTDKEVEYVADAARNAWYGKANMYHERFERAFAEYLGVKYAVALSSCTSALHLSLLALGIGPGDEVIVPDVTWIASAAPITYVGAIPVFADIDEKTWCLSADSFEACITPKTKAVIPVDLYGGVPDWDEILQIAQKHNVAVVEDAAEAIGSEYEGKKAGSFGDTGCFSFHGSKTMTTGEGGMLVTDNKEILDRVLFLMDHGRKPGDVMFLNEAGGYKYKMSSMQAALGLAQIERSDELINKKRRIFSWYKKEMADMDGITLNYEPEGTKNTYWMVSIILDPKFSIKKEELFHRMNEKNICCRPFFYPLSKITAFYETEEAKKARHRNVVSYKVSPYGLNLPCGMNMSEDKVKRVCKNLIEAMK